MIKITNALIIKDFDSNPFYGELVVDENKIVFVGEKSNIECETVVDAKQNIIMPGFVDAHTHSAMTLFKGLDGGKCLQDWLYSMQKKEMNLTSSDVYYGTVLSCFEFAKNGITTVNDNFHLAEYSAKAFADFGMRAVVGLNQRYSMKKFLSVEELEKKYLAIKEFGELITPSFYCHSIYNADEKMFAVCEQLAKKYDCFCSTHASETLEEVGKCASQNNDMSPIELLESYGFFDNKSLIYHATNIDENDIRILAKNNVSVSANFGSNFKLASGIAPIYQMAKYGVNVCLGTDGSASNNKLDMFREMYLAGTSQNVLLSRANCFEAKDILKMATINGAKALGLNNVGTLNVGSFADLIMLDANGINNTPNYDIFENIVFSMGSEDVLMTMINGKVVYQNGKYTFKKSKNSIINKVKEIQKKFI